MRLSKRILQWAAPISLAGVALSGGVEARELSFASGATQNSIGSDAVHLFADTLKEQSDGELTAKVYMQSLLSFMETPAGLRDGMADIGAVLLPYFPSQFPSSILATELSMLLELTDASPQQAGLAYGGAISEYIFQHCPECIAELNAQNQVFIGGSASSPYYLLCNQPVRTLAEVQGKRIRVGGPQWSRWVNEIGAAPVSMAVSEVYEGLSQGVVDCTAQSAPELTSFGLMDVTSHITTGVPGGVYGGIATHINAVTWRSLSEESRRAILRASAVASARITWLYARDDKKNLKTARESEDIQVHEAGAELTEFTGAFIKEDMQAIAADYSERYGMDQADEMIATFRPILEKWVGLVRDVDSGEALAELYWSEVFSKVDVGNYAL